jgi:hypothetical protein
MERDDATCATTTFGTICEPVQDPPTAPIYNHGNLDLLVSGFPGGSTAVSIKIASQTTGIQTQLLFLQYGIGEIGYTPQAIVSARQRLINGPVYPNAFQASFQFPCGIFAEGESEATFDWLLTYYSGEGCAADNVEACSTIIKDVPPLSGERTVVIKNNDEVCNGS